MDYTNVMQNPRIGKVMVSMGVGESGEKLAKAESLLQKLTGRKPIRTVSKHRIPTWGLRKGEAIGCKVTLRGNEAEEFIKRGLHAKNNRLPLSCFEDSGSVSFGIHEYIDILGIKYDPEIGIFGININVVLERPGFRVKRRRLRQSRIPKKNHVRREESIKYFKEKFSTEIEQE